VEDQQIYALSVRPYVGLTLTEARELARREGRVIRMKEQLDAVGRASFNFRRVNVQVSLDGRVLAARKDRSSRRLGASVSQPTAQTPPYDLRG